MEIKYNAEELKYQEITVLGVPALFVEERLDITSIPDELNRYEVRHNGNGDPIQLSQSIVFDFYGTILTIATIKMQEDGYTDVYHKGNWIINAQGCSTIDEFLHKYLD